jgi:hypothetical protein
MGCVKARGASSLAWKGSELSRLRTGQVEVRVSRVAAFSMVRFLRTRRRFLRPDHEKLLRRQTLRGATTTLIASRLWQGASHAVLSFLFFNS